MKETSRLLARAAEGGAEVAAEADAEHDPHAHHGHGNGERLTGEQRMTKGQQAAYFVLRREGLPLDTPVESDSIQNLYSDCCSTLGLFAGHWEVRVKKLKDRNPTRHLVTEDDGLWTQREQQSDTGFAQWMRRAGRVSVTGLFKSLVSSHSGRQALVSLGGAVVYFGGKLWFASSTFGTWDAIGVTSAIWFMGGSIVAAIWRGNEQHRSALLRAMKKYFSDPNTYTFSAVYRFYKLYMDPLDQGGINIRSRFDILETVSTLAQLGPEELDSLFGTPLSQPEWEEEPSKPGTAGKRKGSRTRVEHETTETVVVEHEETETRAIEEDKVEPAEDAVAEADDAPAPTHEKGHVLGVGEGPVGGKHVLLSRHRAFPAFNDGDLDAESILAAQEQVRKVLPPIKLTEAAAQAEDKGATPAPAPAAASTAAASQKAPRSVHDRAQQARQEAAEGKFQQ